MTGGIFQPDDALVETRAVIRNDEETRTMVGLRLVVRRHVIAGIRRQQLLPFVELPAVQQFGLAEEQVFHFGPVGQGRVPVHHSVSIRSRQRRQNVRIWPSSVSNWSSGALCIPRERSFHGAVRQAA